MRQQVHYRIHATTISQFIPKVCDEIYSSLKEKYLSLPNSPKQWEEIADKTTELWQFPNCLDTADGKHISMLKPTGSGSQYYNYRDFFSILLLAFVDYNYKFVFGDVSCQGRISDGVVYRNSSLHTALENNKLNLPN